MHLEHFLSTSNQKTSSSEDGHCASQQGRAFADCQAATGGSGRCESQQCLCLDEKAPRKKIVKTPRLY